MRANYPPLFLWTSSTFARTRSQPFLRVKWQRSYLNRQSGQSWPGELFEYSGIGVGLSEWCSGSSDAELVLLNHSYLCVARLNCLPACQSHRRTNDRTQQFRWHNVRLVGGPKCPGSCSTLTVYMLLERVLDEVPLLERSRTATGCQAENPQSTPGTWAACSTAAMQYLIRKKKINTWKVTTGATVYPE